MQLLPLMEARNITTVKAKLAKRQDFVSRIDLSNGKLRDIPEFCFKENSIFELELSHNAISYISEKLQFLRLLTYVNLSYNRLLVLPTVLCDLSYLKTLEISHNMISDIPEEMKKLKVLEELDISFNQLSNISIHLCNISSLRVLNVSYNFVDCIPSDIAKLSKLCHFDIRGNRLADLPGGLLSLRSLEDFNLDGNPMKSPPLNVVARGLPHILAHLAYQVREQERQVRILRQPSVKLTNRSKTTNLNQELKRHNPQLIDSSTSNHSALNGSSILKDMKRGSTPLSPISNHSFEHLPNTESSNEPHSIRGTDCATTDSLLTELSQGRREGQRYRPDSGYSTTGYFGRSHCLSTTSEQDVVLDDIHASHSTASVLSPRHYQPDQLHLPNYVTANSSTSTDNEDESIILKTPPASHPYNDSRNKPAYTNSQFRSCRTHNRPKKPELVYPMPPDGSLPSSTNSKSVRPSDTSSDQSSLVDVPDWLKIKSSIGENVVPAHSKSRTQTTPASRITNSRQMPVVSKSNTRSIQTASNRPMMKQRQNGFAPKSSSGIGLQQRKPKSKIVTDSRSEPRSSSVKTRNPSIHSPDSTYPDVVRTSSRMGVSLSVRPDQSIRSPPARPPHTRLDQNNNNNNNSNNNGYSGLDLSRITGSPDQGMDSWDQLTEHELDLIRRLKKLFGLPPGLPLQRLARELSSGVLLAQWLNRMLEPRVSLKVFAPSATDACNGQIRADVLRQYRQNLHRCREIMRQNGLPKDYLFSIEVVLKPDQPLGILQLAQSVVALYEAIRPENSKGPSQKKPASAPTTQRSTNHAKRELIISPSNKNTMSTTAKHAIKNQNNVKKEIPSSTWPHRLCSEV